jgi:hypothetical protein
MELWKYGFMKTTLEIPDDLMRRVKIRAAERNQKLKDTVTELIQGGFAASPKAHDTDWPEPILLNCGPLTTEQIEEAIAWGRD